MPRDHHYYCQGRDYSQSRQITITVVVEGTKDEDRGTQEAVLRKKSLRFADPRDQALAAVIHACKNKGEDLFDHLIVRGSVPGFALYTSQSDGVRVGRYDVDDVCIYVAASGSPSPESK